MSDNNQKYDFGGWATKSNIKCADGRIIMPNAFIKNHGQRVPLVWNHRHDNPNEVLGHAILENRPDGVYAYGKFNDTDSGKTAKALVENGDVDKLSIYADNLKSEKANVNHGIIREVSLVLAGANPGAFIDSVIKHDGINNYEEAVIYNDEIIDVEINDAVIIHSTKEEEMEEELKEEDTEKVENVETKEDTKEENVIEHSAEEQEEQEVKEEKKEKTVGEIIDTLTEEQAAAVNELIGEILEETGYNAVDKKEEGEEKTMKHNVFENKEEKEDTLVHSMDIINAAIKDGKRYGSMKESFLQHAAINNITDVAKLFPDAQEVHKQPYMIEKDQSWVGDVISSISKTPFSRVKATFGRMDETEARARGYIKGNEKKDIKMAVLNRVTTPTTVYVKSEIDRDDVVDIADIDVVAWQKVEMRKSLNKELARAILLGDGRDASSADKINEINIRPILTDDDMFTIKYTITDSVDYVSSKQGDSVTKGIIRGAIKARKNYKGSGRPTFFTTEDVLTEMLLLEDVNGRLIYDSEEKLATALRVSKIVTIPEMEGYKDYYGLIVNLNDYKAGADKGGNVNMFDDFDIDYNQMKYLIETRMSGALVVPYSAIALKKSSQPAG